MYLIVLIAACVSEPQNDGFGIVGSVPDQSLDTAEKVEDGVDTSVNDTENNDALEDPFAVDSNPICGTRNIGTSVGDCAENFALIDRDFEMVELHSFAGSVLFLDLSGFG